MRQYTPEQNKLWRQHSLEKNPNMFREASAKYRANNIDVVKAQIYANRYTKLKDKCEQCNSTETLERHHDDYTKPLDVTTFCKKCHGLWHRQFTPKGTPQDIIDFFKNRRCDTCVKVWRSCGRYRRALHGRSCSTWETKVHDSTFVNKESSNGENKK
jgi:hypothetical protein